MDKQLLNEINAAYYGLELKQAEIVHALFSQNLRIGIRLVQRTLS